MVTPGVRIDGLLARMGALLEPMVAGEDARRIFLAAYMRITAAVKAELLAPVGPGFEDPAWIEAWDLAFAALYLDALERWNEEGSAPGPWQVAFEAGTEATRVPPQRQILLGLSAHINYDLPQALLTVINDAGFDDDRLTERRERDHRRIEEVVSNRLREADPPLTAWTDPGEETVLDRVVAPVHRAGSTRLLDGARSTVWRNARALSAARRTGPSAMKTRLDELGTRSAERVADLRRPGSALLRLGRRGFGVLLQGA